MEGVIANELQPSLNEELQDAVSVVNFIQGESVGVKFCVMKWGFWSR